MAKRSYVGNLPWSIDSNGLSDLFSEHGQVTSADVITDRETGRSRGFGFVEMSDDGAAEAAISALHGSIVDGRDLVVNIARERERDSGGSRGPRRY